MKGDTPLEIVNWIVSEESDFLLFIIDGWELHRVYPHSIMIPNIINKYRQYVVEENTEE